MNVLGDILIAIIAGYLAVTSAMADQIIDWLPTDDSTGEVVESETGSDLLSDLVSLPSRFSEIPNILLESSMYQMAAVVGSDGFTEPTTDQPIDAIVNIFCTLSDGTVTRTTTGTGFFIDADGVIMTNAHVAQFLLLAESSSYENAECIIRTGNPAVPEYRAELLYIPPAWIQENAQVRNDAVPMGTGERDYALLYISETIDNSPLPASFPALGYDTELLPVSTKGDEVVAAGYPADTLLANGPQSALIPKQDETSVSELYTFGSNYADLFSIRGSAVGAHGASGGPVVNDAGEVIGMIATRGDDSLDGAGSLRAITLSHVDRTITEETGMELEEHLGGNLAYKSEIFTAALVPLLLQILEQEG